MLQICAQSNPIPPKPVDSDHQVTLDLIGRAVHRHFLSGANSWPHARGLLRCPSRQRHFVHARFAFAILARERTAKSLPQIARFLNRDHSTICHAIARGRALLASDPGFQERHAACVRDLGGLV